MSKIHNYKIVNGVGTILPLTPIKNTGLKVRSSAEDLLNLVLEKAFKYRTVTHGSVTSLS
jgi:hypothetical protein